LSVQMSANSELFQRMDSRDGQKQPNNLFDRNLF